MANVSNRRGGRVLGRLQTEISKGYSKIGRRFATGGEDRAGGFRDGRFGLRADQIDDSAGDGASGVDPANGPWRQTLEMLKQQGVVRAGEHDRVGALGTVLHEAGGDFGSDLRFVDQMTRERRLSH